ncbi:MAG: ribbon-helix-helix protein, CopG family [Pseudorhodoplanes sp.]|jgi:predicted transcriptional regulator|nr:ribbon-helix-helix protein, CopG family [Pseudorhodoplanes sp.]
MTTDKKCRRSEKRQMQCTLLVRLDDQLANKLGAAARAGGSTRPAFVRALLLHHLEQETPAPASVTELQATAPVSRVTDIERLFATAGTHVGRQTGALVQLAKSVRANGGASSLHAEIEKLIIDARKTLACIRDALLEIKP